MKEIDEILSGKMSNEDMEAIELELETLVAEVFMVMHSSLANASNSCCTRSRIKPSRSSQTKNCKKINF
jgi:hypothetical protein